MSGDEMLLAQFISAKFCHDLAGSLGAISNGVDFSSHPSEDIRMKALSLIKRGSSQASARLKFYRQLYGYINADREANFDEIKVTSDAYLEGTNIRLVFDRSFFHVSDVFVYADTGRLLMCLVVCAQEVLIYGGEITVEIYRVDSKTKIVVKAKGRNPKIDVEKHSILVGRNLNYKMSTLNVHSYYTYNLSVKLNIPIKFQVHESQVEYIIEYS